MKIIALTILILLNSTTIFGQANYYVSPTGNNSSSGTLAMPWLTIQYGLTQLATNDTLNVLTGTFTEKLTIPANNIYLRNHLSNTPVIDASGIVFQDPIISINNKSNVTIDGLELKNNIQLNAQGILVDGSGSNIVIKNCKIHDIHFSSNVTAPVSASTNAQGIIVYGTSSTAAITNLKIQNNQLYDCRLGYSEGIAVNGNVNGFEVTNNTVYNLTNIGIDIIGHEGTCSNPTNDQARNGLVKKNIVHHCLSLYASSGGLYIDGGTIITVENNTSYHNGYGIEIGCENVGKTTDGIIIRNNIFYDNEICAVALGGFNYPSGSGKVINSTFRNNTCYYNDFSNSGIGELYLSYSENTIIENNIFYTTAQNVLTYSELTQPSLVFNYNTIYCLSGNASLIADWNGISYAGFTAFKMGSGTNSNSQFSAPQFVFASITIPDFHLTSSSSSSINTGNPFFISAVDEIDIDGELRTNGIVDCGADEYYSATGLNEKIAANQFYISPNPASELLAITFLSKGKISDKILIYNLQGIIVLTIETKQTTTVVDVSNLACGLYFFYNVNYPQHVYKFIKQ